LDIWLIAKLGRFIHVEISGADRLICARFSGK